PISGQGSESWHGRDERDCVLLYGLEESAASQVTAGIQRSDSAVRTRPHRSHPYRKARSSTGPVDNQRRHHRTAVDDGKRCWAISGTLTPVNLNRLRRIARRQRGLFTREQARMCGFTPRQIARRLRSGAWQTVLGRVLAEAGLRINPRVRDWAAQLAVSRSVVAGFAAAREYGIPVPPGSPCIIVPPETHPRLAGVR